MQHDGQEEGAETILRPGKEYRVVHLASALGP
jgi:hypothetical protein